MREPILKNLKARLERWELQHLRNLSTELAERLERAQDEVRYAWECCEMWQSNAMQLQEDLMEEGATIGLTKSGQLVVGHPPSAGEQVHQALLVAESFMCGFEDDDEQEGIKEKLTLLRAAIDIAGITACKAD